MADIPEKLKDAQHRVGAFAKASPELFGGFSRISKVASSAGRFTPAQKEFLAVAIAVASGCEDCVLYHVEAAIRHGGDEAELVEVLEVAVEMGGGPAIMYASKALESMRALR